MAVFQDVQGELVNVMDPKLTHAINSGIFADLSESSLVAFDNRQQYKNNDKKTFSANVPALTTVSIPCLYWMLPLSLCEVEMTKL